MEFYFLKKNKYLLFVLLLLGGCNSFNTVSINDTRNTEIVKDVSNHDQPVLKDKPPLPPLVIETTTVSTCPIFALPNQPSTPEIPLKKLEGINPTDAAAIDKLQRDHILELRKYILKYKQTLKDAHNQYLDKCKK